MPLWLEVTLLAAATAVATGLGAIPFFIVREMSPRTQARAAALAGGAMIGASVGLIMEGFGAGANGEASSAPWRTILGAVAGLVFITATRTLLPHIHIEEELTADGGDDTPSNGPRHKPHRAAIVIIAMTLHSAAEGVGLGVAFGEGQAFGIFITLAIAVHNIPEGLAIAAVMVPRGASPTAAAGWSIVSSLPQPLFALPAFLFVNAFAWWLPVGLGFAAGAMVWMVVAELLPDAYEQSDPDAVSMWTGAGLIAMLALQALLGGGV